MLLHWRRNFRGEWASGWQINPETGLPRAVEVPLPFLCECGQESCYGTIINNSWKWFCSPCWQNSDYWKTQLPI